MPDVIHWQNETAVVREDHWLRLDDEAALPPLDSAKHYLLPMSLWLQLQRAQPDDLGMVGMRARIGVWLTSDAAIDGLLPWLQDIPMIAVHIPTLADGRGYSMARQLRTQYGYQAGLRAFGDITRDQLLFLLRCGFDSIDLRVGSDLKAACQAVTELPSRYQGDALPQVGNARQWSAALAVMYRALEQAGPERANIALASSLSAEDMVLTDLILRHELGIEIFTLDTGRLHADTLRLIDDVEQRYGYRLRVLLPQPGSLEKNIRLHGVNSFYQGQALRQECCHLRKVEPLQRALQGKHAWITGQRREQAISRAALDVIEHDPVRNIPKYNPLADWTEQAVWDYIQAHEVPVNRLYAQGYRSIGCAPCTRPVLPQEPVRAGRWWWETSQLEQHSDVAPVVHAECGLHLDHSGRLVARQEG
jgi:phosphoadenosine phosphosulfate reductase